MADFQAPFGLQNLTIAALRASIEKGFPAADWMRGLAVINGVIVRDEAPLPSQRGKIWHNNLWMKLPGGPHRDLKIEIGYMATVGEKSFGMASLRTDGRLNAGEVNPARAFEGPSIFRLHINPAQLFREIDNKLEEMGVNIENLQTDIKDASERIYRQTFQYSSEAHPADKYDSELIELFKRLKAAGFSNKDIT